MVSMFVSFSGISVSLSSKSQVFIKTELFLQTLTFHFTFHSEFLCFHVNKIFLNIKVRKPLFL